MADSPLSLIPRFGNYVPGVKYRQRPGAYGLLLNKEGLLARITLPHGYFLPGGGIEQGENPETALQREILEETAWNSDIVIRLGQASEYLYTRGDSGGVHKLSTFFVAEVTARSATPAEHEFQWVTPRVLMDSLAHDSQRWAVRQFMPYLDA